MSDVIHSAGAVVWRDGAQGVEALLVHRPQYDDWSLPKGKREPGEHELLTAVREVFEETSVRAVLGPRLPTMEYLAFGTPKKVDYWSATNPGPRAAASHEIDAVSWQPLGTAAARLSYPNDAAVLAALVPRETVPLILLRHASAGSKRDWHGSDESRPLDERGAADARALAGLLACFAPRARVISSPALRCTQTVAPYAAGFGGSVEAEAVLAVHGRSSDHSFSRTGGGVTPGSVIRDLVVAQQPAVVCLHGENLAEALAAACSALGATPPRKAGTRGAALSKGAFWIAHAAAGELAGLERYEPS
ncbi:MAG: NUDIX hydrolase [Streptosporangiaceae bacterium]